MENTNKTAGKTAELNYIGGLDAESFKIASLEDKAEAIAAQEINEYWEQVTA